VFVLSTLASTTLEEVAAASSGPRWFQLYFQESREWTLELVRRAEAAGYTALMVTVDAPINGLRNRLQRIGFQLPPGVSACNLEGFKSPQKEALKPGESVVFQGLMANAPTW